MNNNIFDLLKESIFNWEDLHNKELKIKVEKSEDGILVVGGYDKKEGKMYILHYEVNE